MRPSDCPFTVALIVITVAVSVFGFRSPAFCERHLFSVREILGWKQWSRVITSAFLHADWAHLILNMVTLYLFGPLIEVHFGPVKMLAIYFAAVAGGSLLSLWIHRHHEYRAYGASGGVSGIVFSFVLLFPGASLSMIFLPFWMPGWLYALLYLGFSIYAIKAQWGYVGHDAHVGGALAGLWMTGALVPAAVRASSVLFLAVSAIGILLLLYLARNPLMLPLIHFRSEPKPRAQSTPTRRHRSADVDAVLDKISQQGLHSLTEEERSMLNDVSGKFRRREESTKPDSGLII